MCAATSCDGSAVQVVRATLMFARVVTALIDGVFLRQVQSVSITSKIKPICSRAFTATIVLTKEKSLTHEGRAQRPWTWDLRLLEPLLARQLSATRPTTLALPFTLVVALIILRRPRTSLLIKIRHSLECSSEFIHNRSYLLSFNSIWWFRPIKRYLGMLYLSGRTFSFLLQIPSILLGWDWKIANLSNPINQVQTVLQVRFHIIMVLL